MVDVIFFTLIFFAMGWIFVSQVFYASKRFASRHWPTTSATIGRLFVGKILAFGARASFFEYKFVVHGNGYTGRFLVIDNEEHARILLDKLDGLAIIVGYDPNDPHISFISRPFDPRFEGHTARQNPYWYYGASTSPNYQDLNLKT